VEHADSNWQAAPALTLLGGEIQFISLSDPSRNLSESQSPPGSRRILARLGGLVVITSIGMCIGFDIYREFYQRGPSLMNQSYVQWDGYIHKETTPGRGLFLRFLNFHGQSRQWAARIYFRAVYLLYPQPVLVTKPDVIVNTAPQLLEGNSPPDDQRLIDRGVGSIVVVDFDPLKMKPFVFAVKWLGE
jgi:hypothetical protein